MTLLSDRVALVTGAGSGIGRATALLFAAEGARVAALGRSDEVEETAVAIGRAGGKAMALKADIRDAAAMQAAYRQVDERWGRLDVVVANAGVNGTWAPIDQLEPEDFRETVDINLVGTFLTIKYAAPLLKRRGGSVIITSSVNGTRVFSNTGATAYSATKAGQVAMMKMLALELAKHRIRVNAVCPGAIETNIDENTEREGLEGAGEPAEFPEGRIPLTDGAPGSAEQVAQLMLFLAGDRSSHITGTELWIDGGESLLQG